VKQHPSATRETRAAGSTGRCAPSEQRTSAPANEPPRRRAVLGGAASLSPSRVHGGGGRSCVVGLGSGWILAGWRKGRRMERGRWPATGKSGGGVRSGFRWVGVAGAEPGLGLGCFISFRTLRLGPDTSEFLLLVAKFVWRVRPNTTREFISLTLPT
jgi:hypothetical protein